MQIEFVRPGTPPDWSALERQWRALEAEADGSLFQSWTWLGCRVAARFTDPWLLRATVAGRVVGLALFNRAGPPLARAFWLHETGRRDEDSVFIEHNGPLLARGHAGLLRPMLAVAARHGRLVLGGVNDAVLEAARPLGHCHIAITREAPYAPLDGFHDGAAWLASLGASTRHRLRRSRRSYERSGAIGLRQAADVPEALAFLDALAALHQARWTARGRPGAFAEPAFLAFHRELLARALPSGNIQILQVFVRDDTSFQVLGYLYNLQWRGRIYTYQNGFDYAAAKPHQLPGLTSHHVAIEAAISSGVQAYDFMAGDSRYKTSLGKASERMHWLELVRPGSAHDTVYRVRAALRQIRAGDATAMPEAPAAMPRPSPTRLGWPVAVLAIGLLSVLAWIGVWSLVRLALPGVG